MSKSRSSSRRIASAPSPAATTLYPRRSRIAPHALAHSLFVVDDEQAHVCLGGGRAHEAGTSVFGAGSRIAISKRAPPSGRFLALIEPPCILTMP